MLGMCPAYCAVDLWTRLWIGANLTGRFPMLP